MAEKQANPMTLNRAISTAQTVKDSNKDVISVKPLSHTDPSILKSYVSCEVDLETKEVILYVGNNPIKLRNLMELIDVYIALSKIISSKFKKETIEQIIDLRSYSQVLDFRSIENLYDFYIKNGVSPSMDLTEEQQIEFMKPNSVYVEKANLIINEIKNEKMSKFLELQQRGKRTDLSDISKPQTLTSILQSSTAKVDEQTIEDIKDAIKKYHDQFQTLIVLLSEKGFEKEDVIVLVQSIISECVMSGELQLTAAFGNILDSGLDSGDTSIKRLTFVDAQNVLKNFKVLTDALDVQITMNDNSMVNIDEDENPNLVSYFGTEHITVDQVIEWSRTKGVDYAEEQMSRLEEADRAALLTEIAKKLKYA